MVNAMEEYKLWLSRLEKGSPLYEELLSIEGNAAEITDRFYREIAFGTAGLRGICGAGRNRMNELTVGRATQGIANYILKSGLDLDRGVVIAYDCRYFSREFSELAAEILAGNGIKAYIFPSLRPTPELSFAIRRLQTISGINMTASHNPKEYNGYKVYWEDGAQISGQVSDGMTKEIQALSVFDEFHRIPLAQALAEGNIVMLGEDMDRAYLDYVKGLSQREPEELDLSIPIVYTPLNGAGSLPLEQVMQERGFPNFSIVPEQKDPDPDFTTVPFPNPENAEAFELAEKLGKKVGAELLLATDPDSDRMAVEIRQKDGSYLPLNGNQTGALLISYLAEAKKEKGKLPEKSAMIKSIVTGDFGAAICEDYGITVFDTLTGFKNICGKIPLVEADGYRYFFGYEESIGCAPGEAVRDKDGIAAAMLISEMAAFFRKKGESLGDALEELYQKYGYYAEDQVSIVLKGMEGQEKIDRMMQVFREEKPQSFGAFTVESILDFEHGLADIPAQNCLIYRFEDGGSWFAMRPSGTEPKIKFYYYTVTDEESKSKNRIAALRSAVEERIAQI